MPEKYDGVSPTISLPEEMSPTSNPHNLHPTHFSVGAMPWHLVDCPACDATGNIVILRSVSHEMAVDAGSPELEGQPTADRVTCHLCGGDERIKAIDAKAFLALDPDGQPYTD